MVMKLRRLSTGVVTPVHRRTPRVPLPLSAPDWESVLIRQRERNQNKWSLLKAAMHQLLDKVINKQAKIVID